MTLAYLVSRNLQRQRKVLSWPQVNRKRHMLEADREKSLESFVNSSLRFCRCCSLQEEMLGVWADAGLPGFVVQVDMRG